MRKFIFLLLSLFLVLYGYSQSSMRVEVLHPISCPGAADGKLVLHAIGGVAPFTYNWINLKTNQEFYTTDSIRGGLPSADYNISINGADGKSFDSTYSFKDPAPLLVIANSLSGCYGGNNGSCTATVSGGNAPYNYTWSNGGNTSTISNLSSGSYTVTVTDVYQCTTLIKQVIVQQPSAALAIQETLTQPTSGCNGSISLAVSGGTTPYSFKWSNGETNYKILNLCGGAYSVVVTDGGGCTVSKSFNFNSNYTSNLENLQAIKCFGDANGKLVLHAGGGIAPYKYQWYNAGTGASIPQTDSIATGLVSGNYYVKVIDANSNASTSNSFLLPDPIVLNLQLTSFNGCFGTASASASASVTGGTGMYNYLWSNNFTTATITNIVAGSYTIIVTDNNQCSVTGSINIVEPVALIVQITSNKTSTACNANGSAAANASGGTAPYQYHWSTGNTTFSIDKLAQGKYSVTVTDAHGCTTNSSVTITSAVLPITAQVKVTDAACFGSSSGSATVSLSGGNAPYKYIWSEGSSTISVNDNLMAGSHYVLISDADNCGLAPISFTVSQPSTALSGIISSINAAPCTGANIGSATGSGYGGTAPYTYSWSNGATTAAINNLSPGNYYLTIKDANLCATNLTIIQPDNLKVTFNGVSQIQCPGSNTGSAIAVVTGGIPPYTYQWANGATTDTINNLVAGNYNVIITDANQCSISGTAIISPSSFNVNITQLDIRCFGINDGTALANTTGGKWPYTYLWSNGNTTSGINGASPGAYTVLVKDANQCSLTDTVIFRQPAEFNLLLLNSTNASCNGSNDGSASILVSGGTAPYTYFWKTGNNKIPSNSNLFGGVNILLIRDSSQCPFYGQFTINQPNPIIITFTTTNVNCTGGSNGTASISVTGGSAPYQYKWSNGSTSPAIGNLTVGTYSVTVTDANLCTSTNSVVITKADFKDMALSFITYPANCYNAPTGSIISIVTGGKPPYKYEWSNGDSNYIISNLASGVYQLKVSDDLKCIVTNNAFVDQPKVFSVNLVTQPIKCFNSNDGSISATVFGGTGPYQNLEWYQNGTLISTGNQSLNNLKAGSYKIIATDSRFCKATAEDILIQPTLISFTGFTSKPPVCFGDVGSIAPVGLTGGIGTYIYNWNNQYGSLTSSAYDSILINIKPGFYSLMVNDNNGCKSYISSTILDGATEQIIFEPKGISPTCFGKATGAVTLTKVSGNDPLKFLWSNGETTSNITNLLAGTYSVSISDRFGCLVQPKVTITQPTALYASSMIAKTLSPFNCSTFQNIAQIDSITGGTEPYNVKLYDSTVSKSIQVFINIFNISGGLYPGPVQFYYLGPGKYTAIINDANNCLISEQVQLTSTYLPMSLSISKTDNVCAGGSDGSAILKVADGLKPYKYDWNLGTNETDSFAKNLVNGRYNIFIQDSMKCYAMMDFWIGSPSAIKIDAAFQLPSCPTYCDGAIQLSIQGGVGPYTYLWSNGSKTKDQSGLCGGDYSVVVTDSNNCTATSATIHLFSTTSLHASLGPDYTLCSGQKHFSDATVVNDAASYTWNGPNGFVADGPKQWLTDAGDYNVKVTLGNGCFTNSTLHISRTPTIISSEFIVSSEVFKGDIVGLINISDPKPDSVLWIIPNNPNIIIRDINKNTANLIFNETGIYSIGIRTWLGACDSVFTKKIQVLEPQNFNNSSDLRTPYIKSFTVAPSPNTGQFTVKVGLDEAGDIRLRLINYSSNQVFNDRSEKGLKDYSLQYLVNVPPGMYVLMLETAKGSRLYKIIIN